jgi:site-specific DNA-methyltransferase (adenine-specific)
MARKPLDGTVAANVQKWGTGAINVDGCRVGIDSEDNIYSKNPHTLGTIGKHGIYGKGKDVLFDTSKGRWPANLIHDGSEEVLELFPASKSTGGGGHRKHGIGTGNGIYGAYGERDLPPNVGLGDTGSAARFFYCAKSSRSERTANGTIVNGHPTIKPLSLMRYLCRLVTPPNGLILDPFMGSGTTGMAAKAEGFGFIGIEKEKEYVEIAERRIEATA